MLYLLSIYCPMANIHCQSCGSTSGIVMLATSHSGTLTRLTVRCSYQTVMGCMPRYPLLRTRIPRKPVDVSPPSVFLLDHVGPCNPPV